jgi:hypothetical protein
MIGLSFKLLLYVGFAIDKKRLYVTINVYRFVLTKASHIGILSVALISTCEQECMTGLPVIV